MSDDTITAADFEAASGGDTSTPAPSESAAPVDASAQPEAATTAPADETTATPTTEPAKAGPIPFDAHKTALENARTKAVEEYKAKYGWAEQVQPQEFQQIQQIARHFAGGDVLTGIQSLLAEARKDPAVDAQLRSFHARALAAARGQQPPAAEQEPQPDLPIELEGGRVVHLYSAEQQAKREAYLQKQWLSQVEQRFQPVTQTIEGLQAERAALAQQQEISRYVETTVRELQTWPGMQDEANRKAVADALKTMRVDETDPREVSLALNAAYRAAVLPKLSTASRQAVVDDIHKQANASTVNPALRGTPTAKTLDEMSITEALQHVAAQGA